MTYTLLLPITSSNIIQLYAYILKLVDLIVTFLYLQHDTKGTFCPSLVISDFFFKPIKPMNKQIQ